MENASSPFRTVNQINLSFFNSPRKNKTPNNKKNRKNNNSGAASPYYNKNIFSSPRRRGQVSPAIFDIDMDHASIIGKSTRKKKRKPKLAKKTKQVMVSFLDTSSPSPLKLSKRTNQLFASNNSNNIRRLATNNLMRNNNKRNENNKKKKRNNSNNNNNKKKENNNNYNNNNDKEEEEEEQDIHDMYVPMHSITNLYRRSEIMEHNIEVGIKLHKYLLSQGLTPSKASKMARPYFLEDFRSKTPPKTFSPFRKSARVLFGYDAVTKTPSSNVKQMR